MRRLRKKKALSFKGIVIIFFVTSLFFSVGYSLLFQDLTINTTVNLIDSSKEDVITTTDLSFSYEQSTWYSSGTHYYQLNMSLSNISAFDLSDWSIEMTVPTDFTTVGTCTGASQSGDKLTISGSLIEIDEEKILECQFSSSSETLTLTNITLAGTRIIPASVSVTYKVVNSWNDGKNAQIDFTITNESDVAITSWSFEILLTNGLQMSQAWNVAIEESTDKVTLSSIGWNSDLGPGASTSVGGLFSTTTSLENIEIGKIATTS